MDNVCSARMCTPPRRFPRASPSKSKRVHPHSHRRLLADMEPLPEPEPWQKLAEIARKLPLADDAAQRHLALLAARKARPVLPSQAAFVRQPFGRGGEPRGVGPDRRHPGMEFEQKR